MAASSPVIDYQMGSLLYRLPQELRDQIYTHLFASTRLSRGTRQNTTTTTTRVKTDPNALAILRTCRRARREVSNTWIGQVTFHFEDAATLLDTFTSLPHEMLSQIRRVRVGARKLELGFAGSKFRACYGLAATLKLVPPGLNLDVLTVLGSSCSSSNSSSSDGVVGSEGHGSSLRHDYETLDELVRQGSGWRELRFVSPSSALLGYANVMPSFLMQQQQQEDDDEDDGGGGGGDDSGARECRFWRKPQPAHWRGVVKERDGEMSDPEVTVFRALQPGLGQGLGQGQGQGCGGILDERTRETYEQEVPQGRMAMEDFGIWGDKTLLEDGEREKTLMVVVKRGVGVETEEKEGSPFIRGDIRQEMGGLDWATMRRDHIDFVEEMRVVEDGVEVDAYGDVDEYVWPTVGARSGMNIYAGI